MHIIHDARVFSISLSDCQWIPAREWLAKAGSHASDLSAILGATGSLTRFLQRHYQMNLSLHLHEQFMDHCTSDEAALLHCESYAPCLRRRVALQHRHATMFDAESILPLEGLPTDLIQSLQDGEVPLGNLLLDRGLSLSRSDLSIAKVPHTVDGIQWARCSVLRSESDTQALIIECFYSEMWKRLQRLKTPRQSHANSGV